MLHRIKSPLGQISLAYLTAKTHGLEAEAERLEALLIAAKVAIPTIPSSASLLLPPTPILKAENWPLLQVSKPSVMGGEKGGGLGMMDEDDFHDPAAANGEGQWGGDDDDLFDDEEVYDINHKYCAGVDLILRIYF